MKTAFSRDLAENIARVLSDDYARQVSTEMIRPFDDDGDDRAVQDGTQKFLVPTQDGDQGFFIISGQGNPKLIKRATDNIQLVRQRTSAEVGDGILPPLKTGSIDGFSYAIWPILRPFNQDNRILHYIRCRRYEARVLDWSIKLSQETLTSADTRIFLQDLQNVSENKAFPDTMRAAAVSAAAAITAGAWRPQSCIDHGDFWSGNLLLPKTPGPRPFYVIDWPGMRLPGYPFWDMIRILMSLKSGLGFATKHIKKLAGHLDEPPENCLFYILASVGSFGRNLEYFPEDLYHSTSTRIYHYMEKIGPHLR